MKSGSIDAGAFGRHAYDVPGVTRLDTDALTRVLVVEDDPDNAEATLFILNANGFDAVAAYDGAQAIELARELKPALIVSDLLLPDCTGVELAEAMTADPELRRAPKIAITAALDRDWRDDAFRAGYDLFLAKPVSPQVLLRAIHDLLNRAGTPQI